MAEPSALPADVLEALGHGNPIEAIKRLRAGWLAIAVAVVVTYFLTKS